MNTYTWTRSQKYVKSPLLRVPFPRCRQIYCTSSPVAAAAVNGHTSTRALRKTARNFGTAYDNDNNIIIKYIIRSKYTNWPRQNTRVEQIISILLICFVCISPFTTAQNPMKNLHHYIPTYTL